MPSRERRLLDKDIEIRKLKGELKHYKTCFFSCVFEKDRIRKALEIAVDALNAVTATPLNSRVIHDTANKALEQITELEQKDE